MVQQGVLLVHRTRLTYGHVWLNQLAHAPPSQQQQDAWRAARPVTDVTVEVPQLAACTSKQNSKNQGMRTTSADFFRTACTLSNSGKNAVHMAQEL